MTICKTIAALLIISALFCCRPATNPSPVTKPEDLQGKWKLNSILKDTSLIDREFGEKKPFVSIVYAKRQLQGFSGCNSFGGSFQVKNDKITIPPLTANQIGCTENGERIFFKLLARTDRFDVNRDTLKFLAGDSVLLSFSRDR